MPPTSTARHRIYVPYVRELRAAERRIQAVGVASDVRDSVRTEENGVRVLTRMLLRRRFLVVTDTFAL